MEKTIQHLGSAINYSVEGSGVTLVLLHGFCEDKTIWNDFKQPLLSKTKIISIDLPGFGKSLPSKNHLSMELMAEAVLAVLDEELIDKSAGSGGCFLLGHSMGGYITLSFAEKYADRLNGIGLFHSSCFADDETKKETRKKVAEFVLKNGSEVFARQLFPTLFAAEFAKQNESLIQSLEEIAATYPSESIANASLAMGMRKDSNAFLSETNLPVLMIIGKKDLAIPFDRSLKMAHLPKSASICLLEQSAHMGMFEEPEKSRMAIEDWMQLTTG
ncbi:MAG: alpha/beta hydrolase [Bacteroidota bacterium]